MENTRPSGIWLLISVVFLILSLFPGTVLGLILFFLSILAFAIYAIRTRKFIFKEARNLG